jgi:hypothetical protein
MAICASIGLRQGLTYKRDVRCDVPAELHWHVGSAFTSLRAVVRVAPDSRLCSNTPYAKLRMCGLIASAPLNSVSSNG